MTLSDQICSTYLEQLKSYGEEELCRKMIGVAFLNLESNPHPEYILLDYSEAFLKKFRRTGEEDYFVLARLCRRVAHILYRELIKQNKTSLDFKRFLNAV